VLSADANTRDRILTAEIVLSNSDTFSAPDPDVISLPGEYVSAEGELLTVHPEVMEDPVAKTFLLELGIREGDPLQEVRGIVAAQDDDLEPEAWESFWRLVRLAGHTATAPVLTDSDMFVVHARATDGAFRPVFELLLPGPIVSPDRGEDSEVCLDTTFHADDIELLQNLGLLSAPRLGGGSEREGWFREYVNDRRREFLDSIDRDPHWNMLIFDDRPFAGPLSPILRLPAETRARFTEAALAADPGGEDWVMYHRTRSQDYPQMEMMNPLVWLLIEEGRLNTSLGVKRPYETVGARLKQWSVFFPVAQNISYEQEMMLGLAEEVEDLDGDHWKAAMKIAQGVIDDRQRGRFYGMACRYRRKPTHILARVGKAHQLEEPSAVTVVSDEREMHALANQGTPVLLYDRQDLPVLVEKWGLVSGDSQVKTTVDYVPASSPVPLADRWPLLAFALPSNARHYELVPCESLRLVTVTSESRHMEDIEFHVTESSILHEASMPESDVLRHVVDELSLDLDDEDLVRIIEQRVENERRGELEKIAKIENPAERLIAAVGVEPLRRLAGEALIEGAERVRGDLDDKTLAELVLAAHGVNTLKVLRDDLEHWAPPTQWAGSRRAREFVTSLGFDNTYAGFESAQRDALLPVDGPLKLPELHDFQRSISNDLRGLLTSKDGNRGLVSLPTGAGKTRVAVQTLVEAFKDDDFEGPVLWVAQSDELCEQAVQSWREVWRSEGPEARMHVNRLWGSNEVSAVGSGLQVVVATIQKLRERRDRSDYEWLWRAGCLVIDEAHRAITPEYTALLETFGMGRGKRGIPLIGLTATPFRGENERETQQLASRYGNRLLDVVALGDNPYAALQKMGVLAEVEHEILPGSEVDLTESERDYLEKFERMPSSVEGRLGVDADRNEILLESIGDLPDDWTVLLFAASVEHAQIMAALLSLEGVPARAISAETESGARRHYVEEFRHGRIRVLTNYNVLTQGFDAPAVRAVYVARPTFSTNLYQQMVGRGLRGPLNGGGETCRIVNVADNFLKFGEQLAFHRFDYLWDHSA
jgi:superfamily II DNA or RNA helicase